MLLFAYGTLLHRTGNARVDQVLAQNLKDLGPAFLEGHLFSLGAYPGAVVALKDPTVPRGRIYGRLFEMRDPEFTRATLDAYEDFNPAAPEQAEFAPHFLPVTLSTEGITQKALVYLYNRSVDRLPEIVSGDWLKWRADHQLQEKQKQHLIKPSQAEGLIHRFAQALGGEKMPATKAIGRVLAETIVADRDLPPYDRVAMDGVAIGGMAWEKGCREFRLEARLFAGERPITLNDPYGAIEVMTGAVLPAGCDRVLRIEDLSIENGIAKVQPEVVSKAFGHIHRRGADRNLGDTLLGPGQVLRAPQLGILASVGKSEVQVSRQPRVVVVATGAELVPVETKPLEHQIRVSNASALVAALAPYTSNVKVTLIADELSALTVGLTEAFEAADVVLVTGGVSMGAADLIPQTLQTLGVQEIFHKVKQKPGKPLWFGLTSETTPGGLGRLVFGLPGNPMSVLVCYLRYVAPALRRLLGQRPSVTQTALLSESVKRGPRDFTVFAPARFKTDEQGLNWATPLSHQGSGDFASLAESDGFIILDPEGLSIEAPDFPIGFKGKAMAWES